MCLLPSLKWSSTVSFLGIVQWNFTRRDHPGDPGRVSGSGPVMDMPSELEEKTEDLLPLPLPLSPLWKKLKPWS